MPVTTGFLVERHLRDSMEYVGEGMKGATVCIKESYVSMWQRFLALKAGSNVDVFTTPDHARILEMEELSVSEQTSHTAQSQSSGMAPGSMLM